MKWVTREKARVDRIACPWLISRFIDKEPTFLFVPSDQVKQVAAREGATPYDIPGVELGHHGRAMLVRCLPRKVQARGTRAQDDGADRARRRHGRAPAHARVPGTLRARDRLPGDGEGRPRQYGETVPGVRRAVRLLSCEGEVTEASVRSESRRALGQRGRRKTERESEGELPVGDAAREPSPEARVEPHVSRGPRLPDDTEEHGIALALTPRFLSVNLADEAHSLRDGKLTDQSPDRRLMLVITHDL